MKIGDLTYFIYNTQFGQVTIGSNSEQITQLHLGVKELSGQFKATKITNECSTQLLQYLSGRRKNFTLPIHIQGSEFEKKVWLGLMQVEYGKTITPEQLAEAINLKNSYRNIGKAVKNNKLEILIPTHRLVLKSGFEKPTLKAKQDSALRHLENKFITQN